MTEPIQPPTESGWYVVELDGFKPRFVHVNTHNPDIVFRFPNVLLVWSNDGWTYELRNETYYRQFKVLRYAGPIDPKAYLDEGGKE